MDENTKKEIEKGAEQLGITLDEAMAKFTELCEQNGIEIDNRLGLGLWRNYVANAKRSQQNGNQQNDSYYRAAFGFFVALEAPRDMMSWNRAKAKEEFLRDADNALEKGIVAVATENALGKYVISRYHSGEYREATRDSLPEGAETLEDGRIFIPLDNTLTYMNGGKNTKYGNPLPKEQFRRSGIFFGSIGGQDGMKPYYFSYKNQGGIDFKPNTFEWVHFLCIEGSNGTDIYGATDLTINSLSLNSSLDPESDIYRDMGDFDFQKCLQEHFDNHIVPLVELDKAHVQRMALPAKERYIVTDGTVISMNMIPTKNGNRIINISDLDSTLDDGNDGIYTCWIPEHIELDFGIGSNVIIAGRTSQRTVDGEIEPATINTTGLLCTEKHGSSVEVNQPQEDYTDWF